MSLDTKRLQTLLGFFVRWFNNFCFEKEFFIKNVSILLQVHRDNVGSLEDPSFYDERSLDIPKVITSASPQFSSIMSFEEPLRRPGGESVTSFPLTRVTFNSFNQWRGGRLAGWFVRPFVHLPHFVCDVSVVVDLFALIDFSFSNAFSDCDEDKTTADLQLGVQIDFFDLTSNERINRGMKRAFSIGWTLAQDAASRQLQLSKFKGVRFRRKHNHSKPWIARSKITTGKIRDWINCSTEVVAALASDVGTIYFGKGKEALNFEETPRLLEKVSEDLKEEDQKVQEVRDQVRLLTKNPLVCLIYDLSEELFDLDISLNFKTQGDELYFLLIKLIRLVRRENEAAVSASQPADIPQLLESINQILKRNVAPTGVSGHWYHRLISRFLSRLPPMKAFAKHCSLVPHFIRWVETEVVISRQLSRSSLSPTETEDPPVDISSGCNTPIGHFPHLHEQTQDTLEHGSRDSLSREHGTFQAATPNNQGAIMGIRPSKNNCVDQATTTLSSLAPTDGEIMLFPSHHSDVEVANHISQIGTPEHLEILQDSEDPVQLSNEKMEWTSGNKGFDTRPINKGPGFQMTSMLVASSEYHFDFPFTLDQPATTLSSPVPTIE
ncbi:hypothetical protein CY35_12G002700 [Sphagnum magellanicum]|nr:hypothetical protein CY35_12G002700 [Sphagnum magellanicum]